MTTGATQADLTSPQRLRGRPLSALFRFVPGLRGRLLLAFVAISLFVIAAAAAGLYALREIEQALDRITLNTVPVALDARELWRKSEEIIGVGSALMTSACAGPEEQHAARDQYDKARIALLALDQIQREAGDAFELINRAANAPEAAEIDKLEAEAQRSIRAMDGRVSNFDPDMSLELSAPLRELHRAVIGDVSIFSWIRRGLEAKIDIRRLSAENE